MAAVSNVIPFGLLYMRPLQWCLKTKGVSPRGNLLCMIKGPVLGAPCRRVMLATDASLTGWGVVMSGHPFRGLWSGHHPAWHFSCLEMLAVFQCPWEISLPTLPVLQGTAVSSEPTPQSSARKRSGARELATPAGVSTAASSAVSSNNTRGQSRETGSLSRLFGSVETTAKCVCMGPAYCRARLSHPIQRSAAAFQWGLSHCGEPRAGSGNGTGSRNSVEEGDHRGGPSSREGVRVLQPVLHCSKEGWGPASHFRSETTESFSYRFRLKFKMLTINQVVSQIRSEDWFVMIDLKDAYFHVSILPQHRKFLRFAFRGKAYQYRVLPFGLALSPRTFTKCVDAALAPLRLRGIRTLSYIDDWLILAQSEHMAVQHRDVVLAHLKKLGLRLNAKKSVLSPLQKITYLGVVWDSTTMQARLSPARIESILTAVTRVKEGQSLTVKQFQ
ncbi:enzymatic polyprotein [Labeo rohita]|uniref:ribonuclease H n=1 Tax=Labeo rohita TaxID=84645 RepID=A0ABQ8L7B0_LABRO|nr:enzymatic polyprotein [Labeo rohita]